MSSPLLPLREDQGAALRLAVKTGASPQPPASGDQPLAAGAWKREMERAQLDSWFKPRQAASGAGGRPEGAAGRATLNSSGPHLAPPKKWVTAGGRTPAPGLTAGPAADRAPVMQVPSSAAAYLPKFETGRMGAADIRLGGLVVALAGVSRLKVTGLTPGSDDSAEMSAEAFDGPEGSDAPKARSEESDPDQRAIRLHAEWHGQDVAVWLGIDAGAGAQEDQLAQLLLHIRDCLQAQRSRLVKLVCNGKTVFDVSSSFLPAFPYFTQPKESP